MDLNKQKILWTIAAVAMSGAFASTFIFNYEEDSITYKILCSNGFAFVTGLVISRTYFLWLPVVN